MGSFGSCMTIKNENRLERPSYTEIDIQPTGDFNKDNYYYSNIIFNEFSITTSYHFKLNGIEINEHSNEFYQNKSKVTEMEAENTYETLINNIIEMKRSGEQLDEILNNNFSYLLSYATLKGRGDRGIEENSSFKDGGYTQFEDRGIIHNIPSTVKNNITIGAHNDRPAAFRNMLDLAYLDEKSGADNAIGGYFTAKKVPIYMKRTNNDLKIGGNKRKIRKTKKKRKPIRKYTKKRIL